MEKTYHLDLKTLLEYLRGKSAVLRTTITLPKNRQPCQGYLFLRNGSVIRGYVFNQAGSLLAEEQQAYTLLGAATEWRVSIDTEQATEQAFLSLAQQYSLPLPGLQTNQVVRPPYQKKALDLNALQMFSTKESLLLRSVYTLVNGERSVEQIKAQLHLSPNLIEEALGILRSLGYIE